MKKAKPNFTSIIIPVHNELKYTQLCLASISSNTTQNTYEIIIIDNASTDGTSDYLASLSKLVKVIKFEKNKGVAPAWNAGIQKARGEFLAFLNNDIIVPPNWLINILKAFEDPDVWCACPLHTRLNLPPDFASLAAEVATYKPIYQQLNHFLGFCFVLRRQAIDALGLFDEQFEMGWFEDTDFNYRLWQAGHPPVLVENALIHHFESRTLIHMPKFFDTYPNKNAERFGRKWNLHVPRQIPSEAYLNELRTVKFPNLSLSEKQKHKKKT